MQQLIDKDLQSVQEARLLIKKANGAQAVLNEMTQEQIDAIVKAIAQAGEANAAKLAKMANEETGFGRYEDKIIKNRFASRGLYDAIKDLKTVGVLRELTDEKIIELGVPVGVVVGLVPSTNPTSTVIFKAMIALKAGNAIIFSPHPNAKDCILETVNIITKAAIAAGAPQGAINTLTLPTLEATQELMKNRGTKIILATGGEAMVRSAYSSGKPAIGVGPGNGPAFIDKSADVPKAVKRILASKTFDNGIICASEQSIIVEKAMEAPVMAELKKQGAHFLDERESQKLAKFILRANGTMNPQIVGKSVQNLVNLAGLEGVPENARVLIARETQIGAKIPYSREKLAPILAFYVEDNLDAVLEKSVMILRHEGSGHTFAIHAEDEALVKRFAAKIPASRIIVNSPAALGGIGATTNLFPSLTLGCGAVGGSSSSNNIGPLDLINIKRVAYGVREAEDLAGAAVSSQNSDLAVDETLINDIVRKILVQMI